MKNIIQICAFMENRPGQLAAILNILSANGIDLRALNVAETSDYGVLRFIADDSIEQSANISKIIESFNGDNDNEQ